jgi:hypothetical protein
LIATGVLDTVWVPGGTVTVAEPMWKEMCANGLMFLAGRVLIVVVVVTTGVVGAVVTTGVGVVTSSTGTVASGAVLVV